MTGIDDLLFAPIQPDPLAEIRRRLHSSQGIPRDEMEELLRRADMSDDEIRDMMLRIFDWCEGVGPSPLV